MRRWRRPLDPRGPDENKDSPSRPQVSEPLPAEARASRGEGPAGTTDDRNTRVRQEVRMDRAEERSEVSVVGRGTKIEGTVVAAGSLRVEGEVKGKITANGDVSLSPQGRVEANIEASSITLAGQVKGDLTAKGDVSLPADSRLDGNIRAHNAEVGGEVQGNIVVKGKTQLAPRARVEGDITSKTLAVAEGAVFIGRSIMGEETTLGEETTRPVKRMATVASAGEPSGSTDHG
jgi:cytoskeletal protein CcmA (bactofilin family)